MEDFMAKGISINIGLNELDKNHYPGFRPLVSCRRDAQSMANIAKGFEVILLDKHPKARNVRDAILYAREELVAGDILLVTFSGHGSEIPDESGDESDGYDQTWCLYDRQMIDDELAQLWAGFEAGVRIFFISDSCHSGTVVTTSLAKMKVVGKTNYEQLDLLNSRFDETDSDEFDLNIGSGRLRTLQRWLSVKAFSTHYDKIYKPIIEGLQEELNAKGVKSFNELIKASIISISACQDTQQAKDGDDNGVFTAALKRVWNKGSFQGNYKNFYDAIYKETENTVNPTQNPKYLPINAHEFEKLRPFQI